MPKTNPETVEDWLECIPLPEYLARIPVGCIRPIVGETIWTDGAGNHLTTEQYKEKWGIDPQVAWVAVKVYRRRAGKKDRTVVL
jgi:hypothetical protein